MAAATWKGHLRLSLVSCPIRLLPAVSETGRIRFNQLNGPTGNRVRQQLVDEETRKPVERADIVKGFEFEKGRYIVIDDDEVADLQIESSKIVDLDRFVRLAEVDPVYLDAPYYVHPDGKLADEAFRVIGEAMARREVVGLGRVVIASRERQVLVEPRGAGMLMHTLRASDDVKPAAFDDIRGTLDEAMVKIAEAIIEQRAGAFEPLEFRDRYQDALRALVDSKLKGVPMEAKAVAAPTAAGDLMAALKASLGVVANENEAGAAVKGKRRKPAADRRQANILLPVAGGKAAPEAAPAAAEEPAPKRKRKGAA